MRIKLEKDNSTYRADCLDIPGSPPIGLGITKEEAIADLFINIQQYNLWQYIDLKNIFIC